MHGGEIYCLLIEDDLVDVKTLRKLLPPPGTVRFSLDHADTLAAGLKRLAEKKYDVALVDLSLPDSLGLDTITIVLDHAPDTPIIVMTGLDDETLEIKAVALGAQDYLVKGTISTKLLTRSIRYAIERKRSQQALHESETQFRTVLDHTRDLHYKLNLDTMTYQYISPASSEVTGFTPEEMAAMGPQGILGRIHEEDREKLRVNFRGLVQDPEDELHLTPLEYRWLNKNGEYRWASEYRRLVRDDAGQPAALIGSARDVTDQLVARQEMARMRHYLQEIIDSMPSMLIGVDKQGRVTFWNKEAARATGVPAAEARDKYFGDIYPALREEFYKILEVLREGKMPEHERFTSEDADNAVHCYDLIVYPLSEGMDGAVIRIDDVSSRVQMEEIMVQTEKMMSVGGLAAGMAHEINNPLGGILQACQNIDRRTSPGLAKNIEVAKSLGCDLEVIRKYLEERGVIEFINGIRTDGARAAKIVADMLAFSRRSNSKSELTNVEELVDAVLRLANNDYDLKKQYDFKRVKIVKDFDPAMPTIKCDKTKLEQVLLNLVKNAAQAMAMNPDQQDPELIIRTRLEDTIARVEVIDNGPGMDEKTRRRIFEPFYTTKEVGVGTGLGLSVSYFIITKQHRGTMNVESIPGQGTRFILRLPQSAEE